MRWPIGRGVISRMRLGQYTQDESRIFRKSFWCTAMIGACVKLFKVDRSQRALMAILHRLPTADRPACGRSGNVKPCALFSRLHHLSSLRFGVAGAQGFGCRGVRLYPTGPWVDRCERRSNRVPSRDASKPRGHVMCTEPCGSPGNTVRCMFRLSFGMSVLR